MNDAVEKLAEILDELGRDNSNEYIAHAIIADITETPLAYVKPKPLEWETPEIGIFEAKGIQDYYEIKVLLVGFSLEYHFEPIGKKYGNIYDTLEAAQAAAQLDYATRISKACSISSEPISHQPMIFKKISNDGIEPWK